MTFSQQCNMQAVSYAHIRYKTESMLGWIQYKVNLWQFVADQQRFMVSLYNR